MFVVMLWVLILFVALVANVGQAVNRRIALQVVADAGAYTGATRMAEGLNYMAFANGTIQEAWAYTTYEWNYGSFLSLYACEAYDAAYGTYMGAASVPSTSFWAINSGYGGLEGGSSAGPYSEAIRVSKYNAADLFPGEDLGYAEVDTSGDFVMNPVPRDPGLLMAVVPVEEGTKPNSSPEASDPPPPAPLFQQLGPGYEMNKTVWCHASCGLFCRYPTQRSYYFLPWYKKVVPTTRYFSWIVTAPQTQSMMFDWFFGPNAVPEMKAIAVARPVGGDIEKGQPRYVAQMVPTSRVVFGGVAQDYHSPYGPLRQVTH